jgi:hypothetical protein
MSFGGFDEHTYNTDRTGWNEGLTSVMDIVVVVVEIGHAGFAEGKLASGAVVGADAVQFVAIIICQFALVIRVRR